LLFVVSIIGQIAIAHVPSSHCMTVYPSTYGVPIKVYAAAVEAGFEFYYTTLE